MKPKRKTYRVEGSAVLGVLDNLNGSEIAGLDARVDGQRDLREADGAWVRVVGRADDLEELDHGVGHVLGAVVGAVGAKA